MSTVEKRNAVKKRGRKPQEKVYSLVDKSAQPISRGPVIKESLIVCLKVNRKLFDRLFNHSTPTTIGHTTNRNDSQLLNSPTDVNQCNVTVPHNPEEYSQLLASQNLIYNRLSIPDLYPEVMVELTKEKVVFKEYHQLDAGIINTHLNQQNNYKRVNLLLPTFESGWPEKSNYVCWNCSEKFDNSPIGLPVIQENHKQLEYRMEGNFCSYGCAGRYLFETENGTAFWQRFDILNLLYNQMLGSKEPKKIELAPPRLALKKYGGQLSIEDYRRSQLSQKDYKVYRYPLKPCPFFLEETRQIKQVDPKFVSTDESMKGIEQRYSLYRKKPLPTKSYNIDQCMRIQRKAGKPE